MHVPDAVHTPAKRYNDMKRCPVWQVVMSIMADREQSQTKAALTADDVLQKLRHMPPIPAENATELKEWKMHTPVYKAITEGDKDEAADKNKSKNKGGPKKA